MVGSESSADHYCECVELGEDQNNADYNIVDLQSFDNLLYNTSNCNKDTNQSFLLSVLTFSVNFAFVSEELDASCMIFEVILLQLFTFDTRSSGFVLL